LPTWKLQLTEREATLEIASIRRRVVALLGAVSCQAANGLPAAVIPPADIVDMSGTPPQSGNRTLGLYLIDDSGRANTGGTSTGDPGNSQAASGSPASFAERP
jgi:hypothetical protein